MNLWHDIKHGDIDKLNVIIELFNQDYNDALTFAESDLKTNWLHYKKIFTGEMN